MQMKLSTIAIFLGSLFAFINLFGLTVGLSCFLLIALYIFDEMTYDGFHKKGDHIYRVVETKTSAAGKEIKVGGALLFCAPFHLAYTFERSQIAQANYTLRSPNGEL